MHPLENKSQDIVNESAQKQQQIDAKNQETTNKFDQMIQNHPDRQKDFAIIEDKLDTSKGVEKNLLLNTSGEMFKSTQEEMLNEFDGGKREEAREAVTNPFAYAKKVIIAQRTASHQTMDSAIS